MPSRKGEAKIMWIQPTSNFTSPSPHGGTKPSSLCDVTPATHAQKQDVLYHELRPLWLVFRWLGLFPMKKTATGMTTFRWISKEMVYSLSFYILLNGAIAFQVTSRINLAVSSGLDSTDDKIFLLSLSLFLLPLIVLPPCSWCKARKLADLMNSWVNFQNEFTIVARTSIQLEMRRTTLLSVSLVLVASFVLAALQLRILSNFTNAVEVLAYGYSVSLLNLHMVLWYLMCNVSAGSAYRMMSCFIQDFKRSLGSNSELVSKYRVLWLQLSRLTQEFGDACSYQFLHITLLYVTNNMISFYNVLVYSDFKDEVRVRCALTTALTVAFLTSSLMFFAVTAHNATDQVNNVVSNQLQNLSSDDANTQNQLQRFENTIFMNPPVISLGGYVEVNRKMIVGIFSTTLTYLVVLLQFKINDLSNPAPTRINNSSCFEKQDHK